MKKVKVYGIPNCDATKKALKLLTSKKTTFSFHDYKQDGISREKLAEWCNKLGWESVFNKKSTTWRELSEAVQQKAINEAAAIKIMMQHNSIIKRPVIEIDGEPVMVGFKEDELTKAIK
jgi:Spx/MgsR family transcriptional regulator